MEPGLYDENGKMIKTWKKLLSQKAFIIDDRFNGGKIIWDCDLTIEGKLVLPDEIAAIEDYAFADTKYSEVIISNTLLNLKEGAFENSSITSIRIPNGVAGVPINCFKDCKNLINVNLNKAKWIATSAFENSGIKNINLKCIERIGDNAFKNCKNLGPVTLSGKIKMFKDAFGDEYENPIFFDNKRKILEGLLDEEIIGDYYISNKYNYICNDDSIDILIAAGKSFKEANDINKLKNTYLEEINR